MTRSDTFFGPGVIDTDEWRDEPVRHRYVHGSFEGTDTRFALRFPEPAAYRDRLVQFLQGGMGGNEHQGVELGGPLIAARAGAVYVESNQGHIGNDLSGIKGDMTILAWRASAATARYAKQVASEMYGAPPARSYLFGGSGGAMRTIDCMEREPDLWDGGVPFMVNRNGLLSFNWSIMAWAGSVLGDRIADVVDAISPGGSGDPYSTLDDQQRHALATLYRAGYCRGAEDQLEPNPLWVLGMQLVERADPTYFTDFWKLPGYAGADGSPTVDRMLVEFETPVVAVRTVGELRAIDRADGVLGAVLARAPVDLPLGLDLGDTVPGHRLMGATLRIATGSAAGRELRCTGVVGGAATAVLDPIGLHGIGVGDTVEVSNRDLVAFAHHHRHLVTTRYPEMAPFIVDGRPIHPQRPLDIDRMPVPSGRLAGRMILIEHAHDRECWPSCAQPYVDDVRRRLGDQFDDRFRIWWSERAAHLVPMSPAGRTRYINYMGSVAQAVDDLIAWIETGTAPPASTSYVIDADRRVVLPAAAEERRGIQPVVTVTANGGPRADVSVGEPVVLEAVAAVPPGAGSIVALDWDLDGSGSWPVTGTAGRIEHVYDEPGTYFVACRVGAHRSGDPADLLHRVTNIGRARVVVAG